MELITGKKAAIIGTGRLDKRSIQGKDLLALLIKANMAEDVPDNQRLTDEEVLSGRFISQ